MHILDHVLRANVYIDGFNLFYGRLKGTPYKWLDLQRFCELSLPRLDIQQVYYFSARVHPRNNNLEQPIRQGSYLRALSTREKMQIHLGTFMTAVVKQPVVQTDPETGLWLRDSKGKPIILRDEDESPVMSSVLKTEEKGSDVNLASYLLKDAFTQSCECVVVISNDSDLLTPLRMAREDCGRIVGLMLPRRKGSRELKSLAHFTADIKERLPAAAQLPALLHDQHGPIHKPLDW